MTRTFARRFALLASLVLVVLATMVTPSFAVDDNYTDGTTYQSDQNWGNPPEAPLIDGETICIDPPDVVWMTLHVTEAGTEIDALTFPYIHTQPGLACTPWVQPCTNSDLEIYGTWNIGTGRSPSLILPATPCPEPPTTPPELIPPVTVTNPCELDGSCNHGDVPTAPPATPVLTDVTELALTGPDPVQLVLTAALGMAFLALGFLIVLSTRHEVRRRRVIKW